MRDNTIGKRFWKELEAEGPASRHCLERIPESLFGYKPHERSMTLGYLALLVAEIPKWIALTVEKTEINFDSFKHFEPKTTADLVNHFDENIQAAQKALESVSDDTMSKMFYLKHGDNILLQMPIIESVGSSINHLVHHRGQLTVYMRLNNIPVPSIYGPSADDRTF